MTTKQCPLERAIEILGSQRALAEATGFTPQAISMWRQRRALSLPAAVAVEQATERQVTVQDLWPMLRTRREG